MKWHVVVSVFLLLVVGTATLLVVRGRSVELERKRWGAHVRTYALETPESHWTFDPIENVRQQLVVARELGLTTLRFDNERDLGITREALRLAKEAGFETILIADLDHSEHGWNSTTTDFTALGREHGARVAKALAGYVDIWQVANEVTGSAVHQGEDRGPSIPTRYGLVFDQQRYKNIRDYTRAMGEAIRVYDPKTPIMLTGHWVLIDIFPLLERDGVPFDIIGWNWYSDQGDDPANRIIDEGGSLNLPEEAAKLGKEFMLAEVNYESGSFEGREGRQAEWITRLGANIGRNPKIKGMIFHMLVDKADEFMAGRSTGSLGLVTVTILPNQFAEIGPPKPAFTTYQQVTQRYQTPDGRPLPWFDRLALRATETTRSLAR